MLFVYEEAQFLIDTLLTITFSRNCLYIQNGYTLSFPIIDKLQVICCFTVYLYKKIPQMKHYL